MHLRHLQAKSDLPEAVEDEPVVVGLLPAVSHLTLLGHITVPEVVAWVPHELHNEVVGRLGHLLGSKATGWPIALQVVGAEGPANMSAAAAVHHAPSKSGQ